MKTTIEISDDLIGRAKALAAHENTTLRALVERGLHNVLSVERSSQFRLRDASVGGRGLREEYRNADWAKLREVIYKEHGE